MVTTSNEFSEDTTFEILSSLNVKSLMRFRCVCKYWDALVKNPSFISRHLNNNDDNTLLIVQYETFSHDERKYNLCFFFDETLKDLSYQELNPQIPLYRYCLGLTNGIFCLLGNNNRIILWNMAIRETRILPKCRLALPPYKSIEYYELGFGVGPDTHEYKLVLISALWDEIRVFLYEFSHVAIYDLRTDSWRNIKNNERIPYHLDSQNGNIYLNGVCYWLTSPQNYHQVILSFNFADEVFQDIKKPCMTDPIHNTLGLYGKNLSLLVLNDVHDFFDIWVMRENRWTKQLSVGPIILMVWPLGLWKNDKLLLESRNEELLLYDPGSQEFRDLKLRTLGFKVYTYKESLISIKGNESFDAFDVQWDVLGIH